MASVAESLHEQAQSSRLFFVLSGEHASLPAAEVKAILEANHIEYADCKSNYRLLKLSADTEALQKVSERSLMYNMCGVELETCEATESAIAELVRALPLDDITRGASNFVVRSTRLGGVNKGLLRIDLERELGALIKSQVPRLSVRLISPDLTFNFVLHNDRFLLGLSSYAKQPGSVAARLPRRRPVFHPATMPPKIARCMVNLARATPNGYFADPFCGVGGILIEAGVIGCRVVGLDANMRMLRGVRRNLKHFRLTPSGLMRGDARRLPLRELDAIATDPPYGRDSSTMGLKVANLVDDFLPAAKSALKKNAHLCISAPDKVDIESYARDAGFLFIERHLVRIHRSLTRQFVVLQNR